MKIPIKLFGGFLRSVFVAVFSIVAGFQLVFTIMLDINASIILEILYTETEDHEACLEKLYDWTHERWLGEAGIVIGSGFSAILTLVVALFSKQIQEAWVNQIWVILLGAFICLCAGTFHLCCLFRVHREYRHALNLLRIGKLTKQLIENNGIVS